MKQLHKISVQLWELFIFCFFTLNDVALDKLQVCTNIKIKASEYCLLSSWVPKRFLLYLLTFPFVSLNLDTVFIFLGDRN